MNKILNIIHKKQKPFSPPIWIMRQAGRYLPEYREIRKNVDNFLDLCYNSKLASEVTLQPIKRFDFDAAIIFSDILVIPEAMGLPYQMLESKGPWFEKTIETSADIDKLKIADAGDIQYTTDAIRITKKELNGRVPVIGFAGAPWTILSYMIEGKGSKTFSKAKKFLYTEPKLAHRLLEKITQGGPHFLKLWKNHRVHTHDSRCWNKEERLPTPQ